MNNYCKICFKEIRDYSLYNLMNKHNVLCEECFCKMHAKFLHFTLDNYKGLSIYEYDETIKELIYKFKGCYDYELKDVFIYRYLQYLRLIYRGYIMIPAPSYHIDDEKRGFNHVVEIFKPLRLEMLPIISKNQSYKQSDHSSKGRMDISNILEIDENISLKDKKILLVDDILTTGSTLFSCINLLKKKQPKTIEILVLARTKKKSKTKI